MQQAQNNQDFLFDHTHKSFAEVGGISEKKVRKKALELLKGKRANFETRLFFICGFFTFWLVQSSYNQISQSNLVFL